MMVVKANSQRGVALISVLLVFALAAIIASEVVSRNYRDIRKTANFINAKQAYHYALSGEEFARQILFRDYKNTETDTLTELWAAELDTFEIENGQITIEIHDLQGRFNLNNLINVNGQPNQQAVSQFQSLLSTLALPISYSPLLVDWLDSDSITMANGAEDQEYLDKAYLSANSTLVDKTELRLLNGFAMEDFDKIKKYVTVLPKVIENREIPATKYNLNTLDGKIYQSLAGNQQNVSSVIQRQQRGGYNTVEAWLNNEGRSLSIIQDNLTVNSEFFEVIVRAEFAERSSIIRTQLYRDRKDGSMTVIKRQQGLE